MFRAPPLHIQGHPHSGYPAPMGVGATSSSGRWPEGSEKRLDSTRTGWGERSKGQVTTSGDSSSELWGESGGFGVLLLPCLLPIVSNKSAGSAKKPGVPLQQRLPTSHKPLISACLPGAAILLGRGPEGSLHGKHLDVWGRGSGDGRGEFQTHVLSAVHRKAHADWARTRAHASCVFSGLLGHGWREVWVLPPEVAGMGLRYGSGMTFPAGAPSSHPMQPSNGKRQLFRVP